MAAISMPTTDVRLVIADVDGTLVTQEKVLTPKAYDAVRRLKDASVRFTITSGRPPRGMKMIIDELHLTEPIAAFNGGVMVNPDLSVIHANFLPAEYARKVIEELSRQGLDVWYYTDRDWFVRDPNAPHVAREQWTVQFPPSVVSNFDSLLDRAMKIVGVSDDHAKVARAETELQKVADGHYSATRSQPYYLDVTHPNANKGQVVLDLSRLLNIPTEQIMTIGDGPNDVLMFQRSGFSTAMGNASPEVQHAASSVTTSNEQEGFANALDQFILRRLGKSA
jgi:Cof subfamily protein (haloacid dehalogenase superfamily)